MLLDQVAERVELALALVGEAQGGRRDEADPAAGADPAQQRPAGLVVLEQPVPRGAQGGAHGAALRGALGVGDQRDATVDDRSPVTDLIAADGAAEQGAVATDRAQDLVGREGGGDRQQAEAGDRAGARLDLVDDRLPQQLVAAADAENRIAGGGARDQSTVQRCFAQPREILDRRLRAGNHHQVGAGDVHRRAREAHAHPGLARERVEVGEVAHPAQPHDGDVEAPVLSLDVHPGRPDRERVLGVDAQMLDPRQHAEHRATSQAGDLLEPRGEDGVVPAELVDDEACDVALVLGRERRDRAQERREDAAAVDVADEDHRYAGGPREAHVRQVRRAQVDLRGAAGSLADDDVVARPQVRQRVSHDRPQLVLELRVAAGVDVGVRPSHDDDLAVAVARRLEEDGVHRDLRGHARSRRLHRLRAADLEAAPRDDRVQRHVLRLERRHADAEAAQPAAQAGGHERLAGVGVRAGHEQRALHATPLRCRPTLSAPFTLRPFGAGP